MKFSHCVPYRHLTSRKYHSDLENRTACSLDNCDTIGKTQNIKQKTTIILSKTKTLQKYMPAAKTI